jgi:hypothetical protein
MSHAHPGHPARAFLLGLLLVLAPAALAAALLVGRGAGAPAPRPATPGVHAAAALAHEGRPDLAGLRAARRIARRQLGDARGGLAACRRDHRTAWGHCARRSLSRLSISGRIAGAMLAGTGRSFDAGSCRATALGAANGLRMLAGEASGLTRQLDPAPVLQTAAVRARYADVVALIGLVRGALGGAGWSACRDADRSPAATGPTA